MLQTSLGLLKHKQRDSIPLMYVEELGIETCGWGKVPVDGFIP